MRLLEPPGQVPGMGGEIHRGHVRSRDHIRWCTERYSAITSLSGTGASHKTLVNWVLTATPTGGSVWETSRKYSVP
ncbi:hypothetical protein GCM10018772_34250 [Streptomyces fumanus]|uniref:Uncharacterized protein n=1 Tax=Streptomyces fumanus TaxID=67302 RepID=A0A919AHS1_9ACTN|nr:hypothetical protein GCM10018772_34250 [Streptomyces fumanus]